VRKIETTGEVNLKKEKGIKKCYEGKDKRKKEERFRTCSALGYTTRNLPMYRHRFKEMDLFISRELFFSE
jgi:hypothetical protein